MKNYFKRGVLIIFSCLAIADLQSCKKDKESPLKIEETSLEAIKFQKIEKYISIMWSVPIEQINYNKDTEVFKFKDFSVGKAEIEALYDIANEYKLKQEN